MRRKEFWPLSAAGSLIHKFIPQLCHEADGLIFQGAQVGGSGGWGEGGVGCGLGALALGSG